MNEPQQMGTVDGLLERSRKRRLPNPTIRRMLREEAGLTQQDIAETVGVKRSAVSRWEAGTRSPRSPAADRYADVLRGLAAAATP